MFSKKNSDQQHDNEEETSETTAFLQQAPESQQSQNPLDKIVNNNNSNSNIEIISYKSEGSNQQQEQQQQQAHVTIDISERLKLFKDKAKPLPDLVSKKTKGKSALVSNRRKRTKMSPRDAISQVEADATLTRAI